MAELESAIEKNLIDKLCHDKSQWTYRADIKTEEQLWNNFKYILEQNNKAKLNDVPLSESEFAKIKNDISHASFYEAGKWLVGENGKVYVHIQRGNEMLHLLVMNNEHICGGTSVYEVSDDFIEEAQIGIGTFDNVGECKYSIPSHWDIGKVYKRLIKQVAKYENISIIDALIKVYNSFISTKIDDYNSSVYYENPSCIFESYKENKML